MRSAARRQNASAPRRWDAEALKFQRPFGFGSEFTFALGFGVGFDLGGRSRIPSDTLERSRTVLHNFFARPRMPTTTTIIINNNNQQLQQQQQQQQLGSSLILRFANKIIIKLIQQNHSGKLAARIRFIRDPFNFEIR